MAYFLWYIAYIAIPMLYGFFIVPKFSKGDSFWSTYKNPWMWFWLVLFIFTLNFVGFKIGIYLKN